MWKKWAIPCVLFISSMSILFFFKQNHVSVKEKEIEQLVQQKLYYDAQKRYEQLYQQTNDIRYLYTQAQLFERMNDTDSALTMYETIVDNDPTQQDAYDHIKRLYDDKSDRTYIRLLYKRRQHGFDDAELRAIENTVIPQQFHLVTIHHWYDGIAVVSQKDDGNIEKYGLMDTSGHIVLPLTLDWIGLFDETTGFYPMYRDKELFYGDHNGNKRLHLEHQYERVGPLINNRRWVFKNNAYTFVNDKWEVVTDKMYDDVTNFQSDSAFVKQYNKWIIIDKNGKPLQMEHFDAIAMDNTKNAVVNDRIWLKINKYWHMYTNKLEKIKHEHVTDIAFVKGYEKMAVKLDNGWNFMDENGQLLSKSRYLNAVSFRHQHAFVQVEQNVWTSINLREEQGEKLSAKNITAFDDERFARIDAEEQFYYVKLFDGEDEYGTSHNTTR